MLVPNELQWLNMLIVRDVHVHHVERTQCACLKATSTQNSHVPALDITFGANCNYDEAILLSIDAASNVANWKAQEVSACA